MEKNNQGVLAVGKKEINIIEDINKGLNIDGKWTGEMVEEEDKKDKKDKENTNKEGE